MTLPTAQAMIADLNLSPHPEGGFYRETWRDTKTSGRGSGTAIYFLLANGQASHWHKIDATEIWHYYAGAPLILSLSEAETGPRQDLMLGPDVAAGALPQLIVPPCHWQAARTTGAWSLVGCTVSPGFTFDGFTLAPEGFVIP